MYLTQAYLEDLYGAAKVAAVCPTPGALTAAIELAEAEVESALRIGGYTALVPPSVFTAIGDVPKVVRLAAYRAWLLLTHERHEIPVTREVLEQWRQPLIDLREGAIEIDSPVNTARAPGGTSWTESTTDVNRDPVFDAGSMGDF